jgi:hypothetical protein
MLCVPVQVNVLGWQQSIYLLLYVLILIFLLENEMVECGAVQTSFKF